MWKNSWAWCHMHVILESERLKDYDFKAPVSNKTKNHVVGE